MNPANAHDIDALCCDWIDYIYSQGEVIAIAADASVWTLIDL